jgi:hypothetical protein
MAKRKAAATQEETTTQPPVNGQAESETVTVASQEAPPAAAETPNHAPIAAPPKGEGRAWTIDNRLGYRKEDSADGRKRQIRFADREGGRPDDETLAPVRGKKPAVGWNPKEKSWQARKNQEGLEAIDFADQELAELGRKRTGPQER